MKTVLAAAVVALMAMPVLANDQSFSSNDGPSSAPAPMSSVDDGAPPTEADRAEAESEGIQPQGYGGYRLGWACGWNSGYGPTYYGYGWNRYNAYWGGYRGCGYRSSCACTGCYRTGWWGWSGLGWRRW